MLGGFLGCTWACRASWQAVTPLERARLHMVLWRGFVRALRTTRALAGPVHALLTASVITLISYGTGAASTVALELGVALLPMQLLIGGWLRMSRPIHDPVPLSAAELARQLGDAPVARRVTGLIAVAGMLIAVAHTGS